MSWTRTRCRSLLVCPGCARAAIDRHLPVRFQAASLILMRSSFFSQARRPFREREMSRDAFRSGERNVFFKCGRQCRIRACIAADAAEPRVVCPVLPCPGAGGSANLRQTGQIASSATRARRLCRERDLSDQMRAGQGHPRTALPTLKPPIKRCTEIV